ncbi:MAG: class I SAM-dependent methyltransferase [Candidatus Competibacteraceae bacterium]|nr:class I SAM-dependent methyltransferase [Candidatus Competibacteraceae bacterium]
MIDWQKLQYGLDGLLRRRRQKRMCPSCGSYSAQRVDRKGFHELLRCGRCELLYRWPYENPAEMAHFYQRDYQQPGLTTDLPDPETLHHLLATCFQGSGKDFSRVVDLLQMLSVPTGARILDFGANWGYGVWQFRQAGFSAVGYELSEPRAAYSKNLGVEVFTNWSEIKNKAPFDVVFSSHVLEHTPDPAQALRQKLSVLSPNGWLIAFFPNGSEIFQKAEPTAFHRLWGRVHPVMLNERFIKKVLPGPALAFGAYNQKDLEGFKHWDRTSIWMGTMDTSEMLMLWNRSGMVSEEHNNSSNNTDHRLNGF